MKNPIRIIAPIVIVCVLVVITAGLAFAREANLFEKSGGDLNPAKLMNTVYARLFPSKLAEKTLSQSASNLTKPVFSHFDETSGPASSGSGSSEPLPTQGFVSLSVPSSITSSGEISGELEITGTVEVIMTATWTVSGHTFAVNDETDIEDHIVMGDKVKVELFYDEANVLTASQIELLSEEEQHPVTTEFTGTVEALSTMSVTVSGHILAITDETEIEDHLAVGDKVKVEAFVNPDGSLVAKQIELLEQDNDEDDDHNGQCREGDDDEQGDDDNQGQSQIVCESNHHEDEHEGNHDSHQDDSGGDGENEGDD